MHKTLSLDYTRSETEDCKKKLFFGSQKWVYTPVGLYTRHYSKNFSNNIVSCEKTEASLLSILGAAQATTDSWRCAFRQESEYSFTCVCFRDKNFSFLQ